MLNFIMWVLVVAALLALVALGFLAGVMYYGGTMAVRDIYSRVRNLFKKEPK
jgi:hypothetical protein